MGTERTYFHQTIFNHTPLFLGSIYTYFHMGAFAFH